MSFLEYCQKNKILFKFGNPRNTSEGVCVVAKFGEKIYKATAQNQKIARRLIVEMAEADILGLPKKESNITVLPKTNIGKDKKYIDVRNSEAEKYISQLTDFAEVYLENSRYIVCKQTLLYGTVNKRGKRLEDWEEDDYSDYCYPAKFSWEKTIEGFHVKGVFCVNGFLKTFEHTFTGNEYWDFMVSKYFKQ